LEFPESEYEKLEDRLNKNNEDALPVTIEQADITGATGIYHFKSIEADTIIADGSIFDPMWTTKVPAIDFNGDIPDSLWWCIRVPNMPNLEKIYQMFKKRYNREQAKAIFDNLKLHDNDWMGPAIIIETKEPTDE
jgi:hypothetical protein